MLNYLKNNLRVLGNVMLDFARKSRTLSNKGESAKKIIERINNDGYYILEDYYSKNHCDLLIKEIDNMIEVHGKKVWVDNFGSDHRLYGADRKSDFIVDFFQDRKLRNIAEGYMESHLVGFTLAARLNAKPENLGSGGGWHRDALKKQIKSILYLTDVNEENGPFEYFKKTHQASEKIQNFLLNELKHHTRYSEDEISKFKDKGLKTFTAQAGTVILVDTSGIHRGRPIDEGNRYALTNYFWTDSIPQHISKLFI